MGKEKHTHKLKRYKYSTGNIIYFCTLPDCSYKVTPALVVGKRVICNRCGESFIMNEYSIRLSKPHCTNCHEPKVPLPNPILVKPITPQQKMDIITNELTPSKVQDIFSSKSLFDKLKSVTVTERERDEDESI